MGNKYERSQSASAGARADAVVVVVAELHRCSYVGQLVLASTVNSVSGSDLVKHARKSDAQGIVIYTLKCTSRVISFFF